MKDVISPSLVILQNESTTETRAVRMACLTNDIATANCSLEGLLAYGKELQSGSALPVGSVEFVRQAMHITGIDEPPNISYPEGAQRFLGRKIHRAHVGSVLGTWFVKPVTTKAFTGFVFDTLKDDEQYAASERDSLSAFLRLPADSLVWISEPVTFVSEWRYYVQAGKIIGAARYDPHGSDDAPAPDMAVVLEGIKAAGLPYPHAADFGVLNNGETVLVEANDAWALGLYDKALTPMAYLEFLHSRWQSMVNER